MNAKLITAMGLAAGAGRLRLHAATQRALENARAAVQTAEADPNVNKYAPSGFGSRQEGTRLLPKMQRCITATRKSPAGLPCHAKCAHRPGARGGEGG